MTEGGITPSFSFSKKERLSSRILLQGLFSKGSSFFIYPYKVIYLPSPDPDIPYDRVVFTVPKKRFRKAVTRNLLKRRMREAYRCNKYFPNPEKSRDFGLLIAFIYVAKEELPHSQLQDKLKIVMKRLGKIRNELKHAEHEK
ncbi:ribonuclease P protein component [Roseivirga sp. BDSF3-8]|uniref:ribonuclease P protein component n=1 Tax=Roseivirga sp. BDSF3-8 TaxID=3241598 RepID=UPI0035323F91